MIEKIIDRIADKFIEKHSEEIEKNIQEKIKAQTENFLRQYLRNVVYPIVNEGQVNYYRQIIEKLIWERVREIDQEIHKGFNFFMVYESVERILKERSNDIIQKGYRDKISGVVNEILDKLKNS